ncbi:MAG TPA: flagellar filament capping protein FliD [Acidobacteriaceae bacterium]|jgi:flagellar hook-associated protein 2|nr:flagellar filament capping protein FliD [Acidobacteriaceae bacterium]
MGVVGIAFGSPTAGTGFDVSNTVSQIVANLQNIENPWKSQLNTLQTQDTVISSLGSLLSNLNNDVSQFTDFEGVLAQKEGSSSNPDVLALTSASSAAIAGTHSIVVNSLAATSSGYLDAITNASDTLAGSLTIQVGSGTAQTITVDSSDNTLSGLAAAINSAGIGVTASVLTDTNGARLSLVSGTSGTAGALTVTSAITDATNANTALGYNLATTGANASLTVDGVSISSGSNTVSTVIPGVTFQLLAPSPVTSGTAQAVQVQIVNDTGAVTSALGQFVSDYNAVVSALNVQESNTSSGAPEPLFGTPTLSLLQQQILGAISGPSPSGYLDAIPTKNIADTLTGSLSIASGTGTPTVFNLSSLPVADQNLNGLVSAINAANIGVSASIITNSSGSSLALTSETSSTLAVTSTIADGATTLGYTPGGNVNNLTQLGLTVNNDGSLSINSATLNNELNSEFSGVVNFFQSSNSWGVDFSNTLNNLGTSNVSGTLALALSANSASESSLNQNISDENLRISTEQVSLTLELTSANEILQSIPSNLDEINELYSAITGYQAPKF